MVERGRVAGLDAVRGLAIGLVLARHAAPSLFGGAGIVGVTLFFVLSGYLITGILRRDILERGRIDYRRFYINRALRLLPALAAFLAFFAVAAFALYPPGERAVIATTVLAGLFYAADIPGIPIAGGMTHLWTLAVEEQFYLVWPVLLLLAVRAHRATSLLVAGVAFWLASTLTVLALVGGDASFLYQLPTTWLVALLAGAALRLLPDIDTKIRTWWAAPALVALLALCLLPDAKEHVATYFGMGPAVAISGAVLVAVAARLTKAPAVLSPLVWLGTISYGAYLWNYLLVTWLEGAFPDRWWPPLAGTAATLLIATISWFVIERPALSLKARLTPRPRGRAAHPVTATKSLL